MTHKVGLVVARYHEKITSRMREEAEKAAEENGAQIQQVLTVPGSYDTPLAAQKLAEKDEIDAVTVIGAIVKGDTDHDQVIGHSTAKSLQEVSMDTDTPVTMAITGPGMTAEEAYNRISYAYDAVESALEIVGEFEA